MKKMKRFWIIVSLMCFLILSSFVSADTAPPNATNCSNPNQRILRLSDFYNAHGEVWNGSNNYGYEICFNNYFAGNYTRENPHGCVGNNLVLNLSRLTNAHADGPPGVNFNVPVCYGDLNCELTSDISSCTSGGSLRRAVLLSLSAEQNAHLSQGSRYDSILCCDSAIQAICRRDGYCDADAGETEENCHDCYDACDLNGERGGYEDCDCGGAGQPCSPLQLGGENCSTRLGSGYGGTLGCSDQCTFDDSSCQESGGDNFCITNDTNFWYIESPNCPGPQGCHVQFCADVNKMSQPLNIKQRACQECSRNWNGPPDPVPTSQSCAWDASTNQCYLNKIYTGGLECRQDWIQEGDCNAEGTTRQVLVNYTRMRGEGNCPAAETITIPCSTAVQLPFFSKTSAIISAVIIAVIYLIYIKLKK